MIDDILARLTSYGAWTSLTWGQGPSSFPISPAQVGENDLGLPTPCPAYSLGDLIEHVGGLALAFAAAARKDPGPLTGRQPSWDGARLPAEWRTRIPRDLAVLAQAWREPDAWTGMTRIAGMDAPAGAPGAGAPRPRRSPRAGASAYSTCRSDRRICSG